MLIEIIKNIANNDPNYLAVISPAGKITYGELIASYESFRLEFQKQNITAGSIVYLEDNYGLVGIGKLLALYDLAAIVVMMCSPTTQEKIQLKNIIESEKDHLLIQELRKKNQPGLVLFSSGSTGIPKAGLHNFSSLTSKYQKKSKISKKNIYSFLLFDHIGGINSLLHGLAHQNTLVVSDNRDPFYVAESISKNNVQILPTSPTFLKMLLLNLDQIGPLLQSIELITYGTESMPEYVLENLSKKLPHVTFKQTFGMSEIGILQTKSYSKDSIWLRIGGVEQRIKIIDSELYVKSELTMLGYLNYPSPFQEDQWMPTGDLVAFNHPDNPPYESNTLNEEQCKNLWIKFVGRKNEVINIGGEKVFPLEIENLLESIPEIESAIIASEVNAILGNIIVAYVSPKEKKLSLDDIRKIILNNLVGKIANYKIPQKILLIDKINPTLRFKKCRKV